MTDFRALCVELTHIDDALDGKTPLISNQGQAMDGFSALAAFRDVAERARAALAKPPSLKEQALEAAQRFYAKGHEDCTNQEVKDDFDIIRRALEVLDD